MARPWLRVTGAGGYRTAHLCVGGEVVLSGVAVPVGRVRELVAGLPDLAVRQGPPPDGPADAVSSGPELGDVEE